jgi:hypothetical protein
VKLEQLALYGDFDIESIMMLCGEQLRGEPGLVFLNPDLTPIVCKSRPVY